jgi:Uma2 family endonuclease
LCDDLKYHQVEKKNVRRARILEKKREEEIGNEWKPVSISPNFVVVVVVALDDDRKKKKKNQKSLDK